MQLYIRPISLIPLILSTLFSCGQNQTKVNTAIYDSVTAAFCVCVTKQMRDDKPSTVLDSCYKESIKKHYVDLKKNGNDTSTEEGQLKLSSQITDKKFYFGCNNVYKLLEREWSEADSKKLKFIGSFISQKKLPSGPYEIIIEEKITKEQRAFISDIPLNEVDIKKFEPGYELTVEYEVIHNTKTNKDEYKSKGIRSVGMVKVEAK
jgi:hypothetical protein